MGGSLKLESELISDMLQEATDNLVRMFGAGNKSAVGLLSAPYPKLDQYLRSSYLPRHLSLATHLQLAFLIIQSDWPDILQAAAELPRGQEHDQLTIIMVVAHINAWHLCQDPKAPPSREEPT